MLKKRIVVIVMSMLVIFSVLLAACSPAAESGTQGNEAGDASAAEEPAQQKETITFGDEQWQSLWINNAIAMFIIENGYGYPTESVEVSTPIFQQSIVEDEIQVNMEVWYSNLKEWWDEVRGNGTVIDCGETFESSGQGWFVPRYVIEGDAERGIEPLAPDLKSVYDLPKYASIFPDVEEKEKGVLVSCITGWQCAKVNEIKFHAYGLNEAFNILEPGSQGALDAAIAGAYKKGEPVLSYYWEPTWLLGKYDMVMLEEPEFTAECWGKISAALEDENYDMANVTEDMGCAYENIGIPKVVSAGMAERNPEVVDFLKKMFVGTDTLNKIAAYIEENGVEVEEAALWYFENYQDDWRSWVPAEVAEKVQKAVDAAK